jgi:hypothetical protein
MSEVLKPEDDEMTIKKNFLWLLITPLLIPGILFGVQQWQSGQILSYESGGFKREVEGERAALKKLDWALNQGVGNQRIYVRWFVHKPLLRPMPKRTTELWIYGFLYDKKNSILFKQFISPHFKDLSEVEVTEYRNVTPDSIAVVAGQSGVASDLVQIGAIKWRSGKASLVNNKGPIFQ